MFNITVDDIKNVTIIILVLYLLHIVVNNFIVTEGFGIKDFLMCRKRYYLSTMIGNVKYYLTTKYEKEKYGDKLDACRNIVFLTDNSDDAQEFNFHKEGGKIFLSKDTPITFLIECPNCPTKLCMTGIRDTEDPEAKNRALRFEYEIVEDDEKSPNDRFKLKITLKEDTSAYLASCSMEGYADRILCLSQKDSLAFTLE